MLEIRGVKSYVWAEGGLGGSLRVHAPQTREEPIRTSAWKPIFLPYRIAFRTDTKS